MLNRVTLILLTNKLKNDIYLWNQMISVCSDIRCYCWWTPINLNTCMSAQFKRWPAQRGIPTSAHMSMHPALARHFKPRAVYPQRNEELVYLLSFTTCHQVAAIFTFPYKKTAQSVISTEYSVLQITWICKSQFPHHHHSAILAVFSMTAVYKDWTQHISTTMTDSSSFSPTHKLWDVEILWHIKGWNTDLRQYGTISHLV